jgi:hypothetical protein
LTWANSGSEPKLRGVQLGDLATPAHTSGRANDLRHARLSGLLPAR